MRRLLFSLTAVLIAHSGLNGNTLYQQFVDPPRDYSPMPFWFWNGKMEGPKIAREIDAMADQHVYGSFLHARDGLETPYLSDEWWKAIGAGLKEAKRDNFEFNFVDEYDWPSGEARNIWRPGDQQSEVIAQNPEFQMRSLAYESRVVEGPHQLDLTLHKDLKALVAARWVADDTIDDSTLRLLPARADDQHFTWSVPEGKWVVVEFYLEPSRGFDGGSVDLMNPAAMKAFFDLSYGQYYKRFRAYFGSTIHYSFSDHEGDYGYRIAWTPALFDAFEQHAGYDLRKYLPLLIYDGGNHTTKLRSDYLATVTQLYKASFWDGITQQAAAAGIHRTGHAWEESLQWAAALEGSLFAVERGLNPVGVDSLLDYGRQALNFKVAQSVADFEGRRFMCENQGVQGTESYLDMEGMRKGTNAIGAWGVNLFVPHAFNYDALRANYPPDWLHQPFWPYFHYYADYTRRISYMNAESRHVANVLLYYPITSIWANSRPVFSHDGDYGKIGSPVEWKNVTILINDYYTRIILGLANHHWDYDVADDRYLQEAKVEGNELVIGPQRFRAIILPPLTTLSRATLRKLQEFKEAGGSIFSIRQLPTGSPETGGNDPLIEAGMKDLFDTGSKQANGRAFYVKDSVDDLVDLLDAHVPKDVQVISGPATNLYFEHRRKLDQDYYWVVNDTGQSRTAEALFSTSGTAEKWDALSGQKEPLFYANRKAGTEVRLQLAPWDAYYVVFDKHQAAAQTAELLETNAEQVDSVEPAGDSFRAHVSSPANSRATYVTLRAGDAVYNGRTTEGEAAPISLGDTWQFHPQPAKIAVPYAKVKDIAPGEGESRGWNSPDFDDTGWSPLWLSEAQDTIRKWQMIGPFANPKNSGYIEAYPPEGEFKPEAKYKGLDNEVLGWKDYYGDEPHLALKDWSIWMRTEGGEFSDAAQVVQFDPQLFTSGQEWIVSYAHTYLYSPRAVKGQLLVAADNWLRVWVDHKLVFQKLREPFWYELNNNWADRIPVTLHAGWNEVLLKVGKGRGVASGYYGFTFRVADDNGQTLKEVTAQLEPVAPKPAAEKREEMRWYRIDIPPGCVAVRPPLLHGDFQMTVNGHPVKPDGTGSVQFGSLLRSGKNVLVIAAHKDDRLDAPVEFITGDTPFQLTRWTETGLANFSGTGVYTKSVFIPTSLSGKKLFLNLGRVSSVADVFVNGAHAGTLVWEPYQLDVTKFIKPGNNELKILVTNTEANRRAVGTWRHILPAIQVCGLEGPVQLLPYVDETLTLRKTTAPSQDARR